MLTQHESSNGWVGSALLVLMPGASAAPDQSELTRLGNWGGQVRVTLLLQGGDGTGW